MQNRRYNKPTTQPVKTGAKEKETRVMLWLAFNVVGKVEQHLAELLDTGKLASKQLEDFRKSIKNQKF